MALAQPTPIFGSLQLTHTSGGPNRKNETVLEIPGPIGSFAVVDIHFPNLYFFYGGQYNSPHTFIKVNGKKLLSPIPQDYAVPPNSRFSVNSSVHRGIVIPGGAIITIEYYNSSSLTQNIDSEVSVDVTISGLFYKAS